MPVIPHGVSLSLGGTEPLDRTRLARLADLARRFGSPVVSEHVAFGRAGGMETGHRLPVPLALENIAALVSWPEDEFTEAEFLTGLVARTGVPLLLDVANLLASRVNFGLDPIATLDALPLDRIAYVHVAGGLLRDGVWHDTRAHPVSPEILAILRALADRADLVKLRNWLAKITERDALGASGRAACGRYLGQCEQSIEACAASNGR